MAEVDLPICEWARRGHLRQPWCRDQFAALARAQAAFSDRPALPPSRGLKARLVAALAGRHYAAHGAGRWTTFAHPLYEWSRRLEYPWVAECLVRHRPRPDARLLDAGSGVTFFPAYVASLGYQVTCLDVDPSLPARMAAACAAAGVPTPAYRIGDLRDPTLDLAPADAVMSVSVLEHLPPVDRLPAIARLWAILPPGGLFLCTVDVTPSGSAAEGLPIAAVPAFIEACETILQQSLPRPSVALPRDALTPQRPGYRHLPTRFHTRVLDRPGLTHALDVLRVPQPLYTDPLACLLLAAARR